LTPRSRNFGAANESIATSASLRDALDQPLLRALVSVMDESLARKLDVIELMDEALAAMPPT
jgi:hypothetical protein